MQFFFLAAISLNFIRVSDRRFINQACLCSVPGQHSRCLKRWFPLLIEPLVDYHLVNSRNLQLHLLFTLPTLDQGTALCTMEQLVPLSYQTNGKCFGGTIARHDMVLLTCDNKRYVLKQTARDQCFKEETTVVCPADVLSTVEDPLWLGLK